MIITASVINQYGGENVFINPTTAYALEEAGVLEVKRDTTLGNLRSIVYRKAD